MTHIHIHAPAPMERSVRWFNCHDCKKRSPFAILSYEWYGPSMTCMRCGRNYQDGEWCALDFKRGAREQNKQQMRQAWKRAK